MLVARDRRNAWRVCALRDFKSKLADNNINGKLCVHLVKMCKLCNIPLQVTWIQCFDESSFAHVYDIVLRETFYMQRTKKNCHILNENSIKSKVERSWSQTQHGQADCKHITRYLNVQLFFCGQMSHSQQAHANTDEKRANYNDDIQFAEFEF